MDRSPKYCFFFLSTGFPPHHHTSYIFHERDMRPGKKNRDIGLRFRRKFRQIKTIGKCNPSESDRPLPSYLPRLIMQRGGNCLKTGLRETTTTTNLHFSRYKAWRRPYLKGRKFSSFGTSLLCRKEANAGGKSSPKQRFPRCDIRAPRNGNGPTAERL